MSGDASIICAWCGTSVRAGDAGQPISHGICPRCFEGEMQIAAILDVSNAVADQLPWGLIRMRGDGEIVEFNSVESAMSHLRPKDVIGRHFFHDVAPCTNVREFKGRLEDLRASGESGTAKLDFTFMIPRRPTRVSVRIVYRASDDTSAILVLRHE